MGIFGALTTSVAGLKSESYALENISGNIANSQTTAFKRIDTSFLDLIPQTGNDQQLAGSVTANSRSTNTIQGSVQSAAVSTYMAINGDGFFAVQKPGSFTDNTPIFTGVDNYTRRGDFCARQERLSRQRRRLLSGRCSDRSDHRQSVGRRAAGPEIPERLSALAGDHQDRLPRQSRELSAHHQARHHGAGIGTAASGGLRHQSAGRWNTSRAFHETPRSRQCGKQQPEHAGADHRPPRLRVRRTPTRFASSFSSGQTDYRQDHHRRRYHHQPHSVLHRRRSLPPVAGTTFVDLDTATVGSLLTTIDGITGNAAPNRSTVSGGVITLHTGLANDVTISSTATAALRRLAFPARSPCSAAAAARSAPATWSAATTRHSSTSRSAAAPRPRTTATARR